MDQDNALSESEFLVAMKLVLMRRKGHDIPLTLPDSLLSDLRPREHSFSLSLSLSLSHTHTHIHTHTHTHTHQEASQTTLGVKLTYVKRTLTHQLIH